MLNYLVKTSAQKNIAQKNLYFAAQLAIFLTVGSKLILPPAKEFIYERRITADKIRIYWKVSLL